MIRVYILKRLRLAKYELVILLLARQYIKRKFAPSLK